MEKFGKRDRLGEILWQADQKSRGDLIFLAAVTWFLHPSGSFRVQELEKSFYCEIVSDAWQVPTCGDGLPWNVVGDGCHEDVIPLWACTISRQFFLSAQCVGPLKKKNCHAQCGNYRTMHYLLLYINRICTMVKQEKTMNRN